MPSPNIICEFCQSPHRKDVYAIHVKAKHAKELAAILLDEWRTCSTGTLKGMQRGLKEVNPIWSKRDPCECWIFGVKPSYFREEDPWGAYSRVSDNIEEHGKFLLEICGHIPFLDYLKTEKEWVPKPTEISRLNKELERVNEESKEKEDKLNSTIEYLTDRIHRMENQDMELVEETNAKYKASQEYLQSAKNEIKRLKEQYETKLSDTKEEGEANWINALAKSREVEQKYDLLYDDYIKVKATIKKEAQKMMDRDIEKKKAEKEKEKKKAKEAAKKAKQEAKKAEKLKKKAAKDSDSDSSSDSDSD
jgi:DNA repair exonuclease SbcCD ATPase subunit